MSYLQQPGEYIDVTIRESEPAQYRSRRRKIGGWVLGISAAATVLGVGSVLASNALSDAINPPTPQIGCYLITPQNGMMPDGRHHFTESGISIQLGYDWDYIANLNGSKVNPQAMPAGTPIGIPEGACAKAERLFSSLYQDAA